MIARKESLDLGMVPTQNVEYCQSHDLLWQIMIPCSAVQWIRILRFFFFFFEVSLYFHR
jgi:hypothetical protein